MRVDREIDLLDRVLVLARDHELVDQLSRVRANDVRAEDLAVLRVADDLDEPVRFAEVRARPLAEKGNLPTL